MSKLWLTLVTAMCCCAAMCQTPDNLTRFSGKDSSIQFSNFIVNERNGMAVLQWAASIVRPDYYFIVEKSADGIHFETLSAIGSASAAPDTSFSVTDNSPGTGMIYYRIRVSGGSGNVIYSKTVSTNVISRLDFRFYPNPVDKLLIVRSSHPLLIQVMDAYGIVWFNQDVNAGMQIINVSTLQKGNYILKATDKENGTSISEQLIKN